MSKIMHNVFFKFEFHITKQQINHFIHQLKQLKHAIPEIDNLELRLNQSKEGLNKGFTHLMQIEFADEAALLSYLNHAAHINTMAELIQQQIINVEHSILVFDYSIN